MFKLIVFYKKPADVAAFEKHYKDVHVPLVKKIPHLKSFATTYFTKSLFGESDLYMMAELHFATKEDFDAAMNSPENLATGKDVAGFAKGLVTAFFAKENA
jgi:uncharacterized protein (TIGR02118 family)